MMVGYRNRSTILSVILLFAVISVITVIYKQGEATPQHRTTTRHSDLALSASTKQQQQHFFERNIDHYEPHDVLLPYAGHVPDTIHLIWCDRKWFEFKHMLSLLSIMKKQQPNKVIIHSWKNGPVMRDRNDYNLWYWQLKDEYYNIIESVKEGDPPECSNDEVMTPHILDVLKNNGGIYINDTIVINQHLHHLRNRPLTAAVVDKQKGLVFSNIAFLIAKKGEATTENLSALQSSRDLIECSTSGELSCVVVDSLID